MDGSIRVEWGEPVQFNGTSIWFSSHGQHAWWGGGCKSRMIWIVTIACGGGWGLMGWVLNIFLQIHIIPLTMQYYCLSELERLKLSLTDC